MVVERDLDRNVPAKCRGEKQQRDGETFAAKGTDDNRHRFEAGAPVLFCKRVFAEPAEHVAQPLMRRGRLRIDLQRTLVQIPRAGEVVIFEQCVAEIDQRAQIARMMFERFVVG